MSNLKLGVEVVSAHDLLPKEQGTANAFVEVEFDGQKFRTAIKDRDLNPVWNEQFYFNISDPSRLSERDLEAYVYHANRSSNSKTCLGKVRISGTSFVSQSDATAMHYPLEKRMMLSRARGELGLRVFLTDDPSVRVSAPGQDFDFISTPTTAQEQVAADSIPNPFQETRTNPVRQFQHLPREQHRPPPMAGQPMAGQPYYPEGQELKLLLGLRIPRLLLLLPPLSVSRFASYPFSGLLSSPSLQSSVCLSCAGSTMLSFMSLAMKDDRVCYVLPFVFVSLVNSGAMNEDFPLLCLLSSSEIMLTSSGDNLWTQNF